MDIKQKIAELVTPAIEAMGYDLVRVQLIGKHRPTLQLMVERLDNKAMAVDDCADVSRTVSALLDVNNVIVGSYQLEVSSPGLDRPLIRPKDYNRFIGCEVKIEVRMPIDGRRRFQGVLQGLEADDKVSLKTPENLLHLPLQDIVRAKLVITDDLIATAKKKGLS